MVQATKSFFLLLAVSAAVRLPDGSILVYPPSVTYDSSRNVDPEAVNVWTPNLETTQSPGLRTDLTNWTLFEHKATNLTCTGFLRYGKGEDYSAPIITSVKSATCTLEGVRSLFLNAPSVNTETAKCTCRQSLPMFLTREYQGSRLCFGAPSKQNGWSDFPGLIDCNEQSEFATPIVYHRSSGQIRIYGKCLTASPYSSSTSESEIFNPWVVTWKPCSNLADPESRQAWDAPEGVGIPLADISLPNVDGMNLRPSGHRGSVTLRSSADIGKRCLDVSYKPRNHPVLVKAVFLEAPLCDDVRIAQQDKAVWKFFQTSTSSKSLTSYEFKTCTSSSCSDCGDDAELSLDTSSHPISLPLEYEREAKCNVEFLRELAIPEVKKGDCYCQEHNYLAAKTNLLGTAISLSADDLPTTVRLQSRKKKKKKFSLSAGDIFK